VPHLASMANSPTAAAQTLYGPTKLRAWQRITRSSFSRPNGNRDLVNLSHVGALSKLRISWHMWISVDIGLRAMPCLLFITCLGDLESLARNVASHCLDNVLAHWCFLGSASRAAIFFAPKLPPAALCRYGACGQ